MRNGPQLITWLTTTLSGIRRQANLANLENLNYNLNMILLTNLPSMKIEDNLNCQLLKPMLLSHLRKIQIIAKL